MLVGLLLCCTALALWWLYGLAGKPSRDAWIPAIGTVLAIGIGLVFEFGLSEMTAEVSCGRGAPASYAQVVAAILIALVTGAAIAMGMLAGSRR